MTNMRLAVEAVAPPPTEVHFGREICGNLADAESREWLVTNGIGGFASGTIATSMTRRYHGLLIAALQPPVDRKHLFAALDETIRYAGKSYELATHRWASGAIAPQGYLLLENFRLEGTLPVWTYALADALLEKRVWMVHGENTTWIQYTAIRASSSLQIELKALVNYRNFHSSTHAGDWRVKITSIENGVMILPFEGATPFHLRSPHSSCEPRHEWYRDCFLPMEKERGLDDREDHLLAAVFRAELRARGYVHVSASTEVGRPSAARTSTSQSSGFDAESQNEGLLARAGRAIYEANVLKSWSRQNAGSAPFAPGWLSQLVLAADQFIVKRGLPEEADRHSIIAGYHWFGDWGRDTMIALPGLTLTTGRHDIARQILLSYAHYVNGGMLLNNFPDTGGKPQYNSVDSGLWYIEAVRQYFAAAHDLATLDELYPILSSIIDAHVAGTRYNIHVDPADGLLYAGGPGVQLTWMDAKVGDWVVTPRTGKPIEVNALWINALETMAQFARTTNQSTDPFEHLAERAKVSFSKFWNADRDCCFDVIDSPGPGNTRTNDASLRPNQILAVSLPVNVLSEAQQKSVMDTCARHLATSYGLRSLAPQEPGYQGHYGGDQHSRDAAYHQGTVWGWLLGPFSLAHFRVYHDRAAALRYLEPLGAHIAAFGLGTLAEIFDGDPPHTPRGCIAQAWTVAEVLRAWSELSATS